MKYLLIKLIRLYQAGVSPLLGSHCKFHPTCSSYSIEAINKHGACRGAALSVKRVLRCNPWNSRGGLDPVE
tara:strand:- start:522 stop:734 length:213 start_codon:yes stop_codon:yes gene_type:complete